MDWWTILFTLIGGLLLIYLFLTKDSNYFKNRGIPCLKPNPVLGNTAKMIFRMESPMDVLNRSYNCHPDAKYVGYLEFSTPIIILKDPELVKTITVKNFDSFPNHRMFGDASKEPLFQKNLFALKDGAWRDMRALLSPAFTSSKMKTMFKILSQCAVDFSDHLVKLDPQPEATDMKDTFGRYTLDVIASVAFGLSVNSMKNRDNEFYLMGKSVTDFSGWKMLKFFVMMGCPWLAKLLNVRILDEKTSNYFTNVIQSTIATRDAEGIVRPDMINLMMETRDRKEKSSLSPEDMAAQAFIFLFGGFDSPATTMSFAAYLLALNPDPQRKLQAEIDQVLEQNSDQVSYEDLHAMTYLDAVVTETLRMFPPTGVIDRVAAKSFTLPPALPGLEPLEIKPGQIISIPLYSLHHDPRHYPNPETFDPERFMKDNMSGINPLTYLPFGAGPRICIANRFALMEVKLVLFHVLAKCSLLATPATTNPIKLDRKTLAMKPEGGFLLKVVPRN